MDQEWTKRYGTLQIYKQLLEAGKPLLFLSIEVRIRTAKFT